MATVSTLEDEKYLLGQLEKLCLTERGCMKSIELRMQQVQEEYRSQRKALLSLKVVCSAVDEIMEAYLVFKMSNKDSSDGSFETDLPFSSEEYETWKRLLIRSLAAEYTKIPGTNDTEEESQDKNEREFDIAGSSSHYLGIWPQELIQDNINERADMVPYVSEIEHGIKSKRQFLAQVWQPGIDTQSLEMDSAWLSNSVEHSLNSIPIRLKSINDQESTLFGMFSEYIQEQNTCLETIVFLLEHFKLGLFWKHASSRIAYLTKKADLLESHLRQQESDSLLEANPKDTVLERKHTKANLDRQVKLLTEKRHKMQSKLEEYESMGEEFLELTRRYRDITSRLENQQYLYEELTKDLSEAASESVGYTAEDPHYEDSTGETLG